ncbi:MAG: hypothetical protein WC965_01045 [Thiohalomonadaceae bacterium]
MTLQEVFALAETNPKVHREPGVVYVKDGMVSYYLASDSMGDGSWVVYQDNVESFLRGEKE